MAKYIKVASLADAESFDGSQVSADALVVAYPAIIAISKEESHYEVYEGENNLVAGDTEVEGTFTTSEAGSETVPAVVSLQITNACEVDGDLTISILGAEPVVYALTDALDTADKVAAEIRSKGYAGFVVTGATDTAIFTVKEPFDAILNVLNTDGENMNAYASNVIVFNKDMDVSGIETQSTEIWTAANFALYYTAVQS